MRDPRRKSLPNWRGSRDLEAGLTARLALARHRRGDARLAAGDVDQAFDDFAATWPLEQHAGTLPRRLSGLRPASSCEVRRPLYEALCSDCRELLAGDVGRTLRAFLQRVKDPVPTDLEWFGHGCDECYRTYKTIDPHLAGMVLVRQTDCYFFTGRYEDCVRVNRQARTLLDHRRDPLLWDGLVPINLALAFGSLEHWEDAKTTLTKCRFDREIHAGLAATEVFMNGCLTLGPGRAEDSLAFFHDSEERFQRLHRLLDAALAASYSIEAYALLGRGDRARESADRALRFFEEAGCRQAVRDPVPSDFKRYPRGSMTGPFPP
jgi:tetratricopeptide (TPR) repeat protein